MLHGSHERLPYQDFLISESRKGLIPPDLYDALIPQFQDDMVIMDFGCGLGYTSGFYSEKFKDRGDFKIFACDYQVEILDVLWRRIVENKFQNITPFFMPNRSRLHFPKWILPVDHLFFSLSLSATENPIDILKTIKPILKEGALVHIIGWDKDKNHPLLDPLYPQSDRLSLGQIERYLAHAKYNVIRHYKTSGPFYALTASAIEEPKVPEQDYNLAFETLGSIKGNAQKAPAKGDQPDEQANPVPLKSAPGKTMDEFGMYQNLGDEPDMNLAPDKNPDELPGDTPDTKDETPPG